MALGAESLLPPVLAILLAIVTRKVILPLALGVLLGAWLLARADGAPVWSATTQIFITSIWESISATSHRQVVLFTILLGAMVGVMEGGGSMVGLIRLLSNRIRTRRSGQTMIAGAGLVIFFDDYANSLLVGGTMRSTADRYGISREKLAYLVDSTAAPIAGLSLISTWAAVELDYIAGGLATAGIADPAAAMTMFIQSIPYRFYAWLALILVFLIAVSGRDFGPMRTAENNTGAPTGDFASSNDTTARWLWLAAVIPVVACVSAVVATLIWTGLTVIAASDGSATNSGLGHAIAVLGNGDGYVALIIGSALGLVAALVLNGTIGRRDLRRLVRDALRGSWQMAPAILILWFAWALSSMTGNDQLNTGGYLASILDDRIGPEALPTIVFVIAGFVAFATGTSWGTMAILTPLSIELAFRLVADVDPSNQIVLATCGSVLAGAIFGDHCSPISDTTVLSSRASGCDHVAHVRTQMPYAVTAGMVAIATGTLPAAFGLSPWFCLAMGIGALSTLVAWFGHPTVKQER